MKGSIIKKSVWVLALSASLVSQAFSAEEYSAIQAQLKKVIPDAPAAQITPSPFPGVYQVSVGPMVIYMSKDGQYLLNGDLIRLDTRENLTELAKASARKSELDKIEESTLIVYPAQGEQKHRVTVFTDIDCPYCAKLHKEIPELNKAGIAVRYMAHPRSGLATPSYLKAVSVWCSADKGKTMDEAMKGGVVEPKTCKNPVENHMMQAELFGVNGTPNIVLDSGELLPGYVPAKELIKLLAK
ncbi:DsbC family protein [Thiomicrorhabdus aquaedulcis]|uniref:DsbC family protein n=1 Tax=Thiomicrorhabdus aquaedulcis TaxID=2211106 RepID=UPI000FDB3E7B|nr:DsbC family protein [Thiomicrorhabdus aquaedulcis]